MSKFQKWFQKSMCYAYSPASEVAAEDGWNAACKSILAKIRYKNKVFEGNWQREDIDSLIEEIQGMVEKD